ncbi:RluA family pseudouridine synthase [Lentilactobacillus farraginis]|uniref:Pseudouridine synthase n=1 Tax=Lentilactobacillus farraginis DSM 18382 = JCM 14108 TaxID=1423743 RepID=X0PH86_9LACO|nr:RluA family pseudouridine synthase [Lentilactobacillus farraginis]KRM00996.1 pseudouridylate synthase [Lentilactobacillus farraginis DSM 18382 = JCM 14108]GAF35796.1 ribosomal large subunit pseudouridine synthase D [Lentilactobacillus farraginis DSM 18382 = JCM 14108]
MTEFNWTYQGKAPIKVRTFIMGYGITRTLLKKIKYHGGKTLVNGEPVLVNRKLTTNDIVTVVLPPEPENDHVPPSNLPIRIIFEDEHFLIVNKPAGVASVPAHNRANDSLVNRVKGYYQRQHYANQKIHIVTRLDKDTSGLVIFAKHHFAHSVLDKQLKDHRIKKTYLAIVAGQFSTDHFEIYLPIRRAADSLVKREIGLPGKMSVTEAWPLRRLKNRTLVKIRLHTGRTHQIRVHMKAVGHPLVGDWLYNPKDESFPRQALHCWQLRFFNPFCGRFINCTAPLPSDMKTYLAVYER